MDIVDNAAVQFTASNNFASEIKARIERSEVVTRWRCFISFRRIPIWIVQCGKFGSYTFEDTCCDMASQLD